MWFWRSACSIQVAPDQNEASLHAYPFPQVESLPPSLGDPLHRRSQSFQGLAKRPVSRKHLITALRGVQILVLGPVISGNDGRGELAKAKTRCNVIYRSNPVASP